MKLKGNIPDAAQLLRKALAICEREPGVNNELATLVRRRLENLPKTGDI